MSTLCTALLIMALMADWFFVLEVNDEFLIPLEVTELPFWEDNKLLVLPINSETTPIDNHVVVIDPAGFPIDSFIK